MKRLTAVITLLGSISAIYFSIAAFQGWFPFNPKPKLELSKYVITDDQGQFPLIDVTIKNIGKETAILDKVSFHATEIAALTATTRMMFNQTLVSAQYEMKFELAGSGTSNLALHHDIREHDVDRFTFLLKHDAPARQDLVIRLAGRLTYDDGASIEFPSTLLIATRPGVKSRYFSPNKEVRDKLKMVALLKDQKSEGLQTLIEEIAGDVRNHADTTVGYE